MYIYYTRSKLYYESTDFTDLLVENKLVFLSKYVTVKFYMKKISTTVKPVCSLAPI